MKNVLLILSILFLSCVKRQNNEMPAIFKNDINSVNGSNVELQLIIGGKQYRNFFTKQTYTLDNISEIEDLVLIIDRLDPFGITNLDGIEQLYESKNIKTIWISIEDINGFDLSPLERFKDITELDIKLNGNSSILPDLTSYKKMSSLGIYDVVFNDFYKLKLPPDLKGFALRGKNLHNVDMDTIETLNELTGLRLEGDITRLPNLTKLEKLRSITIEHAKLDSLEGIGAPNVKKIEISNLAKEIPPFVHLNNLSYLEKLVINGGGSKVYKISDISNLPKLKDITLLMYGSKIDLSGIENLSALENILFMEENLFLLNIEGIGKLRNLRQLYLQLSSSEPSLEFLCNMHNLVDLSLSTNRKIEQYQILDVSPLATLKSLRRLSCTDFIIKNIASLDVLEALSIEDDESPGYIYLAGCKLYDETEKSKHPLVLEHPTRE